MLRHRDHRLHFGHADAGMRVGIQLGQARVDLLPSGHRERRRVHDAPITVRLDGSISALLRSISPATVSAGLAVRSGAAAKPASCAVTGRARRRDNASRIRGRTAGRGRVPVMTGPQTVLASEADDVERHPCPRCDAARGSSCRSRSGAVAGIYHTGRFTKVPRLAKLLRVPTPADRGPGQPWRPGTPAPEPVDPDTPTADIRIGYARAPASPRNSSRSSTRSPDTASPGTRSSPRRSASGCGCAVRGRARRREREQGARPALPGDLHGVRDEAPGATPQS